MGCRHHGVLGIAAIELAAHASHDRRGGLTDAEFAARRTGDGADCLDAQDTRKRDHDAVDAGTARERQRARIALALACRPRLLLADEPTTAVDATVQTQILLLLGELQRETGMAMIFVSHDLGAAIEVADRIAVMYAGRIVEENAVAALVGETMHHYTAGLLASTVGEAERGRPLATIPGAPPDLSAPVPGCAFAPRVLRRSRAAVSIGRRWCATGRRRSRAGGRSQRATSSSSPDRTKREFPRHRRITPVEGVRRHGLDRDQAGGPAGILQ